MVFGKKGRPPEDRLARQREIYRAVSPLILRDGVRQLSMRRAAQEACVSIGGLYHYFPTKRDLVLHGLRPEALLRHCQDFHAEFGYLADQNPERYIAEGLDFLARHVSFCRPAVHAALEMGAESFWEVIDTLLESSALEVEANLQRVAPGMSAEDLHRCGRMVRRSLCAALLDKRITLSELRDELRMFVQGYMGGAGGAEQTLVEVRSAERVGSR